MSKKAEKSCKTEDRGRYEAEHLESEEEYYIKAFKRLDKTGKHTWNWAAFLFGSAWMAYRKMYLYALFFTLISKVFERCALLYLSFNVYGNLSSFRLLEDEHTGLYLSVLICTELVSGLFTGYFGNALYYRIVKKKIQKGYHLLQKYCPTSVPSIFCWPFICFADWISRKLQQKTKVKGEINEETIRAYLDPDKENHLSVKIANVLGCLIFIIASLIIIANDSYNKVVTQITTEKKSNF